MKNAKSLILHHCERSELKVQKFIKNAKNGRFGELFENVKITVLPDRSILIEQKLVESAKIEILKCDIFGDFQTMTSS